MKTQHWKRPRSIGIGFDFVDHVAPHPRGGDEAVHEDERDAVRIVGLELIEPGGVHVVADAHRPHEAGDLLVRRRIVGERRGEIRSERAHPPVHPGFRLVARIAQGEHGFGAVEIERGGDRRGDTHPRRERRARVFLAHADQRATDAFL